MPIGSTSLGVYGSQGNATGMTESKGIAGGAKKIKKC